MDIRTPLRRFRSMSEQRGCCAFLVIVSALSLGGTGPSVMITATQAASQAAQVLAERNLVANGSVERDTAGWDPVTSDPGLLVEYSRDPSMGSDGVASLRQDIVDTASAAPGAEAQWQYRLEVDSSWAGARLTGTVTTRTTDPALSPHLMIEFFRIDESIGRLASEFDSIQPGAWETQTLTDVVVPDEATTIVVAAMTRVDLLSPPGTVWFDDVVLVRDREPGFRAGDAAMFRGDSTRSGRQPGPDILVQPEQQWAFATGDSVLSSPAVAEGTIYVGSLDNSLYAVDAEGDLKWRSITDDSVASSPAVVDGTVYVGSYDGYLYALKASTGARRWRAEVGQVAGGPAVDDGVVYVSSYDGSIYALSANDGSQLWRFATGAEIVSSPAVADGVVFSANIVGVLFAVDAATGEVRWERNINAQYSSPMIAEGTIYIGSVQGYVLALDAADGDEIWRYTTASSVVASPAISRGMVFVGSTDGSVYALDAETGEPRWSHATDGEVLSSPVIGPNLVYVANMVGSLTALDQLTGDVMWTIAVGSGIYSSPAVVDGVIYVGGVDGHIYAFVEPEP